MIDEKECAMAVSCDWVDVGGGLKAYYGQPDGDGPHPCVLVYIEAFGVNDHEKLTAESWQTMVLRPSHRISMTARFTPTTTSMAPSTSWKTMDDGTVMHQTEQCLDWLAGRTEADTSRAGVTGFCIETLPSLILEWARGSGSGVILWRWD